MPETKIRAEREASEVVQAAERMLRALVRRAEAGDLDALEGLASLERTAASSVALAMIGAHDGPAHYSWTEVGQAIGISRQAARQRALGA